jgi:hypothetical protein
VLEFCYAANGNEYRLESGHVVFKLVDRADNFRRKQILAHLLSHFDTDFPNHPQSAEALLLGAHVTAHDLDDFARARQLILHIRIHHRHLQKDPRFQALAAVLRSGQA